MNDRCEKCNKTAPAFWHCMIANVSRYLCQKCATNVNIKSGPYTTSRKYDAIEHEYAYERTAFERFLE